MNAERLARWWVDRYTGGLPEHARDDRRAEVASDLWEHRAATGDGLGVQLAIVSRCVRGIPADLIWRRSHRRRRARPTRGALLRGTGWAFAGAGYALLVIQHAWLSTALFGLDLYGAGWAPGDVGRWSRISAGLGAALLGGGLVLRPAPRTGAVLVAGGALGTAGVMWWLLPVLGPVAIAVAVAAATLASRRRASLHAARSTRRRLA